MIRREDWKYIYYHEQPSQLFNLREDPEELVDRAEDPGCQRILQDLRGEILREWDPEQVRRKMAQKNADEPILVSWARNTGPEERYRWPMLKEMKLAGLTGGGRVSALRHLVSDDPQQFCILFQECVCPCRVHLVHGYLLLNEGLK